MAGEDVGIYDNACNILDLIKNIYDIPNILTQLLTIKPMSSENMTTSVRPNPFGLLVPHLLFTFPFFNVKE